MLWGENLACQCTYDSQGKKKNLWSWSLLLPVCWLQWSAWSHRPGDAHSKSPCLMSHLACGFKFEGRGLMEGREQTPLYTWIIASRSSGAHSLQDAGWAASMATESTYSKMYFLSWVNRARLSHGTCVRGLAGSCWLAYWCAQPWPSLTGDRREGPELRMRGEMGCLGVEGAKGGNCHFFRSITWESLKIQFRFHKFVNTLHDHRAPALWKLLYFSSYQKLRMRNKFYKQPSSSVVPASIDLDNFTLETYFLFWSCYCAGAHLPLSPK